MNSETILVVVIPAIISFCVVYYEYKKGIRLDNSNNYHFKLPKFFGVIGISSMIFGIWSSITFFSIDSSYTKLITFLGVVLIFLGTYMMLDTFISKTIVNEKEIKGINLFGKERIIKWEELDNISFNKLSQLLKFSSKNKAVYVQSTCIGLEILIKMIERKTNYTTQGYPYNKNK